MSAPNKTKEGNKAISYLFRTHLHHHICHSVRLLGCHVKNGSFPSSSMNCMSMDSITEVFYHLNRMLIATKHIADNNLSFSKTAQWYILYAALSKPINFTFSDL